MRLIKMLGLAAIAAVAAMAFVGAGSASAETLCLQNVGHPNECPSGRRWTGDVIGLTTAANPALLLGPFGGVLEECHSTVLGLFIKNEGAHTGVLYLIDTAGIRFTSCSGICVKATSEAPAWMLVEASTLDAWVTADGSLPPSAKLEECEFGVDCLYRFTNAKSLLKVEGDTIKASQVALTESTSEFLCPNNTSWDATYLVTEDENGSSNGNPLYLAALP